MKDGLFSKSIKYILLSRSFCSGSLLFEHSLLFFLKALCSDAFRWPVKFPLVILYNRPIVTEPIS